MMSSTTDPVSRTLHPNVKELLKVREQPGTCKVCSGFGALSKWGEDLCPLCDGIGKASEEYLREYVIAGPFGDPEMPEKDKELRENNG